MRKIKVNGKNIAYNQTGQGAPIVFLHGNPTSSYLWRNIVPHLESNASCYVFDLIGMGSSDKLDNPGSSSYRFEEHFNYINQAINEVLPNEKITLVLHDWGSALGFHWAHQNQKRIQGIAYMEGIVKELEWNDWNEKSRALFQALRSDAGDELILQKNVFIEKILLGSIIRELTQDEIEEYRKPFLNPGEDRRVMLSWPREIPIDGQPDNVCKIVSEYSDWMSKNNLPKLFINAEPGAIIQGSVRDFCRTWRNQSEITVEGIHFIQEDSPNEIGKAIQQWHKKIKKD
ncbi:MAG: haloalkane dehalogenase [Gammaproteobacteria bacterium]|jgi:haloalkane dehalogenase|nr:haloalkane dehalogenase [Gammaproteobacteria bacterium]HJL80123.1 haloalkane dehalogenase [Gammaproteobacteria bacterium]HJM08804.1 haloalkane dehalogenase [Gammaproteobacteria bacterium]HJN00163.1 haloalkane dehalogenase [Gammaproteobacteria bacterium]|tara:strand:- start:12938 stop:13798 length:861 start_codon:yes stop_codon:yes gene_type:complete